MRNPPLLFYFHPSSTKLDYGGQVAKGYVETSYGGQGFSTRRARKNLRVLKKLKIISP